MVHQLQKYILNQLTRRPECRYRDIKPKEVEGNLFMYHLRALQKEKLLEKTSTGLYRLTADGLHYTDGLSQENFQPRIQPKIVTLLACQNDAGGWLLYRRGRQPFHGLLGFPYGKIHLGETIQEAAERELKEKTGLVADLAHAGDAYLTVFQRDEIISQMFCHIFVGSNATGIVMEKSEIGECSWQSIDKLGDDYMPGFREIFSHLNTGGDRFFDQIVIRQD